MIGTVVALEYECGHPSPELLPLGDTGRCDECPKSQRSNESQTVTWTVAPLRRVVAVRRRRPVVDEAMTSDDRAAWHRDMELIGRQKQRIDLALALHAEVVHVFGGTVCAVCFTDDETPEPFPCRTRRLLTGEAP